MLRNIGPKIAAIAMISVSERLDWPPEFAAVLLGPFVEVCDAADPSVAVVPENPRLRVLGPLVGLCYAAVSGSSSRESMTHSVALRS